MLRFLCFAFAATLVATDTSGQVLQGKFIDANGEPVIATLVTLSGPDGMRVAQALTDSNGIYVIEGREPGFHTLRIDRIGFAPRHGSVMLAAGATGLTDTLRMTPIALGEIRAGAVAACTDERVSSLWQEARKALRVIALAEDLGLVRVNGVRYLREIDGTSRTQLAVINQEAFAQSGVPVREPPREARSGHWFAIADSTQTFYFAASPRALASDEFERDHCPTRITVAASDPNRVGIEFEPQRGARAVGITATMWFDRATARPLSVEYTYEVGSGATTRIASGTLEFSVPQKGVPHVSRWSLRLPVTRAVTTTGQSSQREVRTIVEDGALVFGAAQTPLSDPDGVFPLLTSVYKLDPIVVEAEARNRRRVIISTPSSGPANVLSDWEIQYTVPTNAYDLVFSLRPRWLRGRGLPKGPTDPLSVAVYVDDRRVSDAGYNAREALKDIPVPDIEAIQYLDPIEAPMVYGMVAYDGAILIRLKRFR